ncbi:fumarylacetoacetate hydrolase family protein [Streptomyces europaeiscabiei]|uniref:fumarylacetoacetate hydrolase family protein n=1 Tax=Streptomyces europaeiscabiei TaxID=146819 RepID=UPI0038F80D02
MRRAAGADPAARAAARWGVRPGPCPQHHPPVPPYRGQRAHHAPEGAVLGHRHGRADPLPEGSPDEVDYEGELAVVIGRRATDVSAVEAEAYAFVAGFTIVNDVNDVNDVSARDVQKGRIPGRSANVTAAKSLDTFTPMGPALNTLDEVTDPDDLRLRIRGDDELRQDARTSQLIHPVPALVTCLSRQTTLEPGDVISTGTPAGVGHRQGLFLRSGTEVRIGIEGIGALVNTCA